MTEPASPTPRDFDAWAALASNDPQAFEQQRSLVIHRAIQRAPARKRLRLSRLQWRLDRIRETSRTPMAACLRMQAMMWQSVEGENGLLACLQQPSAMLERRARPPVPSGRILPLRRRNPA
jgi:hypothetical protein